MIIRAEFTDFGKILNSLFFFLNLIGKKKITSRTPSQGVANCLGSKDYNLRFTALSNPTFHVPLVTREWWTFSFGLKDNIPKRRIPKNLLNKGSKTEKKGLHSNDEILVSSDNPLLQNSLRKGTNTYEVY